MPPVLAYCGSPPIPGALNWNLDPVLLASLAGAGAFFFVAAERGPAPPSRQRQAMVYAGLAVVALALVSPLCNLSVALFSARVGQHMVITLVGLPLMVAGGFDTLLARHLGLRPGLVAGQRLAVSGPLLFAALFWFWHFGRPYDGTLQSTPVYWAMHLSLIVAGLLLWRAIFSPNPMAGLAASFVTGLQMTVLGALLTLSARPWYAAHEATTQAWGYSPLEDQQLGGLIMWVPGGMLLALHAIVVLGVALTRLEGSRPAMRAS